MKLIRHYLKMILRLLRWFRPTAENFAKYIFDEFKNKGYDVRAVEVYETPKNCARYEEG